MFFLCLSQKVIGKKMTTEITAGANGNSTVTNVFGQFVKVQLSIWHISLISVYCTAPRKFLKSSENDVSEIDTSLIVMSRTSNVLTIIIQCQSEEMAFNKMAI